MTTSLIRPVAVLAALLLSIAASAGSVTFVEAYREVRAVGVGPVGQSCTAIPNVDCTEEFGAFIGAVGVLDFASGFASQLSAVNPSSAVFGDCDVTLAATPTCGVGNLVRTDIELRLEVVGNVLVILSGDLAASANAAGSAEARVCIEDLGSGRCAYEAVATGEGDFSAAVPCDAQITLPAGSYRLTITAVAADGTPDVLNLGSAECNVELSFPVTPNDDCAEAAPLALDDFVVFDTTFATDDGPPSPECAGGGTVGRDVWFVHQSACDAWLILTSCGLAEFDTAILVYDGCPEGGGALLACNDDDIDCPEGNSQLRFPSFAGVTYWIRVGGVDGAGGLGGLIVTCEIPNDFCGDSFAIGTGPTAFSTVGATTDGPPIEAGCDGSSATGPAQIVDDIWFEHVATCSGELRAATCAGADFDSADFNSAVAIYAGACPEAGAQPLACSDDAPGCGSGGVAAARVVAGALYTVRVGGSAAAGRTSGHGTLTLECGACPADFTGDGSVDGADLGVLLAQWGSGDGRGTPLGDLDGSGAVDGADLGELLGAWGACP